MFNNVPFALCTITVNICSGIPSANTVHMLLSTTHTVTIKVLYILYFFQKIGDFHEDFNDVLAETR